MDSKRKLNQSGFTSNNQDYWDLFTMLGSQASLEIICYAIKLYFMHAFERCVKTLKAKLLQLVKLVQRNLKGVLRLFTYILLELLFIPEKL